MPTNERQGDSRGTLFLVVGPSGVGKDSLIAYCQARAASGAVVYPRRCITRATGDASEDHDHVSEETFAERVALGDFALHWRAHGLNYGIPTSIEDDLVEGRNVVVNVSRAVVRDARRRFAPVVIVSVGAAPDMLAERIRRRGRETGETIDQRLARAGAYEVGGSDVFPLDNSGPIDRAGDRLVALVTGRKGSG